MDRNHFKIQCMCVYLEISVNTWSFKNCSTQHIQFDFYSNTRNVPRNFTFPNEILSEISLSEEQKAARNFNDMWTIGASKYRRKFAFFEMSHNFGKFCRNLLSLILHSTEGFEKKKLFFRISTIFSDNELQMCCKHIKPGSKAKCEMIFRSIKRGILSLC